MSSDAQFPPGMVGPFWVVEEKARAIVLAAPVPLNQAVAYGDMLTVETGHLEHWAKLARRGAADLRRTGLPTAPVWSEYEEWPRGRVLYDTIQGIFIMRADRKLHRSAFRSLVCSAFDIPAGDVRILSDDHYRSIRPIGHLIKNEE